MELQEFKCWIENCVKDARIKGMSDDAILVELIEQIRMMLTKKQIEILGRP